MPIEDPTVELWIERLKKKWWEEASEETREKVVKNGWFGPKGGIQDKLVELVEFFVSMLREAPELDPDKVSEALLELDISEIEDLETAKKELAMRLGEYASYYYEQLAEKLEEEKEKPEKYRRRISELERDIRKLTEILQWAGFSKQEIEMLKKSPSKALEIFKAKYAPPPPPPKPPEKPAPKLFTKEEIEKIREEWRRRTESEILRLGIPPEPEI